MAIKLIIPGEPIPQGRPKFARRGSFVTAYDPKKSKDYKQLVKQVVSKQYVGKPLSMALKIDLQVFRPVQKSISHKEREMRLSGLHRPIIKGDIDNYFKAVTDALTGIVWVDDAQIVSTSIDKWYSDDPRVELVITVPESKQIELVKQI
ncbi:RusA family crossover junction endodeoxyribonuclease [Paucilactobacillus kaifaensis]|uniref:RusA family crossover junction endodeoxyribonuclease n=1 Tax=Paucilactobacillus kaifaensis TaxID=2559921 RepID=UPI0010F99ACB|nr:RusA family crossover junction endodeoxyribonuclease [Paucilactobacillus kaifaensis]